MTGLETIRKAIRFLRGGYDDQSTCHKASEHENAALVALADISRRWDERKNLLDAIASALHGWPDDGTRRTYDPSELPELAKLLRVKAEGNMGPIWKGDRLPRCPGCMFPSGMHGEGCENGADQGTAAFAACVCGAEHRPGSAHAGHCPRNLFAKP